MTPLGGRLVLLAAAVLTAACDDATSTDPLDRQLVAELARSRGDATGSKRTDDWTMLVEQQECGCLDEIARFICIPEQLTGIAVVIDVVEGGGFMLMRGPLIGPAAGVSYETSGAIEEDGSFDLGFVEIELALATKIMTVARMQGEFADDDNSFTATLQARVSGNFGDLNGSCSTTIDIVGERGF